MPSDRSDRRKVDKDRTLHREAMRQHGSYASARLAVQASWCYERLETDDLSATQRRDLLERAARLQRVALAIASEHYDRD